MKTSECTGRFVIYFADSLALFRLRHSTYSDLLLLLIGFL